MKLAGIAIVRNECDVIEVFVRHNLRFLDHLTVVDNLSMDTTARILDLLREEGLPIEVMSSDMPDHPQQEVLNRLLARFANEGYDFIFALDADEFISADGRSAIETSLTAIPEGHYGIMAWQHYTATERDDPAEINVLKRISHVLRVDQRDTRAGQSPLPDQ